MTIHTPPPAAASAAADPWTLPDPMTLQAAVERGTGLALHAQLRAVERAADLAQAALLFGLRAGLGSALAAQRFATAPSPETGAALWSHMLFGTFEEFAAETGRASHLMAGAVADAAATARAEADIALAAGRTPEIG